MQNAFEVLVLGLILLLFIVGIRLYKIKNIPLRNNCLLTKFPILFLHSNLNYLNILHVIKRFLNPEKINPLYLKAHGYLVLEMTEKQFVAQVSALKKYFSGVHIFAEPDVAASNSENRAPDHDFIKSFHRVQPLANQECLNLAISLAENDFQCSI